MPVSTEFAAALLSFRYPSYTHVWSKPSGWKQGSHPKFLGPLGSTILPFKEEKFITM